MRKKKTKNSLIKFECESEDKTSLTNPAKMMLVSGCLSINRTLFMIAIRMLLTPLITITKKTQI